MKIQYFNDLDRFPYIIIDEFYNESEIEELWEELDYMCNSRRLVLASKDRGAAHDNGKLLKFNHCQYLDSMYANRSQSNILDVTTKLFMEEKRIFEDHPHWYFKDMQRINLDYTQVSYYEHKDEYQSHRDRAIFTSLTWFYKKPKKYSGGDFWFEDFNFGLECLNNRTVIFPSVIRHAVRPIKMEEKFMGQKCGRFCISQFMCTKFQH